MRKAMPTARNPLDDVLAHYPRDRGGDRPAGQRRFRGRLRARPEGVAENVTRCIATGVAGLSIEDFTGDDANPLYDFDLALARVKAARAAIDKAGGDVVFTARTEGFIHGRPDLDETIRRLKAFADAGADCLYSPGIKTREQIAATVKAVAPKPVNFLNSGSFGSFTIERSRQPRRAPHQRRRLAGARGDARLPQDARPRSPTRASSTASPGMISNPELNKFFTEDRKKRSS